MAFGNMNERQPGRLGGPRPSAVAPPTVPAPPATPAGRMKPNVANEPPVGAKPPRPARVNPNAAPDPTKGALPPRFANMVKGGMTEAQARQKWARSLQNRGKLGPGTPGGTTPPPPPGGGSGGSGGPAPSGPVGQPKPAPFVPSPAPMPGAPVYGGPMGELQGKFSPGGGSPMGGPGSPIVPGGNDFRDPMTSFLAAVPLMNMNTKKQIDDALSQFGGGGLRWGTDAAGKAAEIGAQAGLQQNQMLTNALMGYANQQEDRALQATGMGIGLGGMLDQQAQDRVKLPFMLGQYEQGRQDDLSRLYYDDFEKNKTGWLPYMLSAAQGQSGPTQGTLVPMPGDPGKPGAIDYIDLISKFFG